jgi:hypothetical protein
LEAGPPINPAAITAAITAAKVVWADAFDGLDGFMLLAGYGWRFTIYFWNDGITTSWLFICRLRFYYECRTSSRHFLSLVKQFLPYAL